MAFNKFAYQQCINPDCHSTYDCSQVVFQCQQCGGLLDVEYEWEKLSVPERLSEIGGFDGQTGVSRPACMTASGVWRYWNLLPFADHEHLITIGEGKTILQKSRALSRQLELKGHLHLQYEGFNPSGSFKDNGMAACLTHASLVNANTAACASTGNTSASLALFASVTGKFNALVFVGSGKIAFGKLSQALDYGARTIQIDGDFDDAMQRVQEVCKRESIYLVNSLNPFRLEGQKTILFRILEGLNWQIPDWIIVPGGNLGNSSAIGKALEELLRLGLINKCPRLAVINADGASTFDKLVNQHNVSWNHGNLNQVAIDSCYQKMDEGKERARTIASAIEINRPVNLNKCLRAIEVTKGVVESVSDQEILDAKALIAANGYGCEPASAASVAGLKKLLHNKIIDSESNVVCVLTGHQLKDPNSTVSYHQNDTGTFAKQFGQFGVTSAQHRNAPLLVENSIDKIIAAIKSNQA